MGKAGPKDKSFDISKRVVWEAYKSVKANKGAAGVDGQSIEEFEADLKNNLYKIWNRMSSGTYFPPPVRAVEIPKPHGGGTRILGIPTVADRIAQTVVALQLLPRTEAIFHRDSYGYRPGRSPLMAVKKCRERCWKKDWVLDLDVQKFFDSVDHDLMVKAVEANTDQKWVVLYVKRWLKAPMQMPDGTAVERDRGTPQGSAVSPVLANLFMHYAFDSWLEREFPTVEFERFADDAVVHCVTERQARQVWAALAGRLDSVGLRLHPDKTKIVYCGDSNRRREFARISFTFLGYAFRPRESKAGKTGTIFTSFQPAMSPVALKSKSQELRRWRIHRRTTMDLRELSEWLNPIVRGWMNYYGEFNRSEMYSLLERINTYLMRWARKKYRRLRTWKRFKAWCVGSPRGNPSSSLTGHGCARTGGLDEKSGMTGDCHVPFRGSLGVKLPGATRLVKKMAKTLRTVERPCPHHLPLGEARAMFDVDDAVLRSPRTPLCGDELSHQPNGRLVGLEPRCPPPRPRRGRRSRQLGV